MLSLILVEQLSESKIGQGLTRVLHENPVVSQEALRTARLNGTLNEQTDKIEVTVKKITAADPYNNDLRVSGRTFTINISVNRYGQIKDYMCSLVIGDGPEKIPQKFGWIRCDSDIDVLNFNVMKNGFLEANELF